MGLSKTATVGSLSLGELQVLALAFGSCHYSFKMHVPFWKGA